jgi:hypothetical protein
LKWFAPAASLVYAALALWAVLTAEPWGVDLTARPAAAAGVALTVWGVPTLAALAAAAALNTVTPRRALRHAGRVRSAALGLAAGLLGAALLTLGVAFLSEHLPDGVIAASAGALGALGVLAPTRRVRPGACPACGYSLAGATPAGRGLCAECGADVMGAG